MPGFNDEARSLQRIRGESNGVGTKALGFKFSDAIVETKFSTDAKKVWLIGNEKSQRHKPSTRES